MDDNLQSSLLGKIAAYTEILVKDPRSTIFVSLAETYRKMGMFDDARKIIDKGLQLHPDFSPAHIVLARVLCQQDDYPGSIDAFEKALEIDPESLAALVGYARVRILLGEEDSARDLLLRARQLSPADPVINKLLLSLPEEVTDEVTAERPDAGAEDVVDEVTAELPDEAPDEMVDEEFAQDSVTAADSEEDADGQATVEPGLVSMTLAELYERQGLTDEALRLYQQLLALNPDDLNLRHKIRDLETGPEQEATSAGQDTGADDASEPTDTDEGSVLEATAPGDSDTPVEAAHSSGGLTDEPDISEQEQTVVATLNQWLSNIQQRRRDV